MKTLELEQNLQGDMKLMKCNWLDNIDVSNLANKKILIAGGTGFIGKRLVEILESCNAKVCVISRKKHIDSSNTKYIVGDLTDYEKLKSLQTENFDISVYMAANIPLAGQKKETYYEAKKTTLDPFLNFCDIFLPKTKKFIYISSIDVLGACEIKNYSEGTAINNPTPYGIAKYCGEFYTKLMCDQLSINYTILRFSQVYGPNEPIVRIIPIIKDSLIKGKEFNLFTHGTETRKFLYVDDATQAIIRCALSDVQGVFNIAGKDETSILTLIDEMEKVFNKKLKLNLLKQVEGKSNVPSIDKAVKLLKYEPYFDITTGLKEIKECENI